MEKYRVGEDYNSLQLVAIGRVALDRRVTIHLRPHEKCLSVMIDDDRVVFQFETFLVKETRTRTTLLKRGRRVIEFNRARPWITDEMTLWDDEFEPVTTVNIGRTESPEEYQARRAWEADCHRPGSHRTPLDSAARTAAEFAHPTMVDYWKKG